MRMADDLRLEAYTPAHRARWDNFVRIAKIRALIFERDFMDYHADRFVDASLLAFRGETLVAVLPASRHSESGADWLVSHGGLTFGGWITGDRMTATGMLQIFELLRSHSQRVGFSHLRYKPSPHCYHRAPADEDLYALHRLGARVTRVDASSVINLQAAPTWSTLRRRQLKKAVKHGVTVELCVNSPAFVAMLAQVLAAHGAVPVHSAAELDLLANRFPNRIRLYAARAADGPIAYALVFDSGQTIHTQYLATNAEGRAWGGLEAILHHLQTVDYADRRYLSFGISTTNNGHSLNEGLIRQKEGFGGRTQVCLCYELPLRD